MRWDKLRFVGATNVDLPLVGADPAGPFVLKSADGLGPPERAVKMGATSGEGSVRQGTRAQDRQVVARIGLQPNWDIAQTAGDLREILYGLLTPKFDLPAKLQIMNGAVVLAEATGDLSKFEASMFSKDPEVQVTMDCDYPYLLAPAVLYQTPAETISGSQTVLTIQNSGTAPAGFSTQIVFPSGHNGTFQLSENYAFGKRISINDTFAPGDEISINTMAGSRGVWKKLAGQSVYTSILSKLSGDSPWIQLHGGENKLLVNNTDISFWGPGFSHTPAYWGV